MTLFVFAEAPLNDFNVNIFRRGYLVTTYSCKAKGHTRSLRTVNKKALISSTFAIQSGLLFFRSFRAQ